MLKKPGKKLSLGWTLALILLTIYFLLKAQGWWYAFQVQRLSNRIADLRPSISAIIRSEQIKATGAAYARTFDEFRKEPLDSAGFLKILSEQIPPSVTLVELSLNHRSGFILEGTIIPGSRSPEEALLSWVQRLQNHRTEVRVRKLFPDPRSPGTWRFELRSQQVNRG